MTKAELKDQLDSQTRLVEAVREDHRQTLVHLDQAHAEIAACKQSLRQMRAKNEALRSALEAASRAVYAAGKAMGETAAAV